jgi:hypothetical protein
LATSAKKGFEVVNSFFQDGACKAEWLEGVVDSITVVLGRLSVGLLKPKDSLRNSHYDKWSEHLLQIAHMVFPDKLH